MYAFTKFARRQSNERRRRTRRLELLEDRCLLAADVSSLSAGALAPFSPSGPAFTGGYLDLATAAAVVRQNPIVTGGYTPQQLRHAYGLDQSVNGETLDGSGQTIAIIALGDDPYIGMELANFDAAAGLPNPRLFKVTQPDPDGAPEPVGAATETALDVEWAHAMAPGAAIELVEGNPDDYTQYPGQQLPAAVAFLNAVSYASQDPNVSVISMSYGWSETDFTQYGYQVPNNYFVTPPGHQGITFVAASGDRDIAVHHYYPSDYTGRFPAESPNVVGVGATVAAVDSQGDWLSESADPISGGGFAQEAEPAYQRSSGMGNSLGARMSPDVSWTDSAIWIYSEYAPRGPWVQEVGTSASAPQFAGFMAQVDQGRALRGATTLDGPSQTLPLLYFLQDSFHDIRQFANTQTGGSPAFSPMHGYDLVTGLGTPIAGLLMPQLIAGGYMALDVTGGAAIEAAPGQSLDEELATFSDPNGAMEQSRYVATIEWGDGSYSISAIGVDAHGKLAVFGSHVYQQAGQFTITVTIGSQRPNAVVEGEALDSAVVQIPSLVATGGFNLTATEGVEFSNQVVATFTDPMNSGNYSANIDYGDGSSASGAIVAEGGGNYEVLAFHVYGRIQPEYTISVTIARTSDQQTITVISTADVATPPVPDPNAGGNGGGAGGRGVGGAEPMPGNLGAIAEQLTNSAESYGDFVSAAYQQYLGRAPDGPGLSHWVALMQHGLTDEQLEANFLAAPEYVADHGGSDVNWVIGMYHDLLGRAPDGTGLAYWTGQIGAGVPEYHIALGFAASAEREATVVRNDFLTYLDRAASEDDVNYWVAQFLHGARNEDVIAGFVASPEYYNLPEKGNGDRTRWLDCAFDDIYGRLPSNDEVSQWLSEMR